MINHSRAGEGYWNYIKMALQTEDVITVMDILEPCIQQLNQYNWRFGHKATGEGALTITSMNGGYGGVGSKHIHKSTLTAGDVGNAEAVLYKIVLNDVCKWSLSKSKDDTPGTVTAIDCCHYIGDTRSFQFNIAANNLLPPFNKLDAPHNNTQVGVNAKTKKPIIIKLGYAGVGKGIMQSVLGEGVMD